MQAVPATSAAPGRDRFLDLVRAGSIVAVVAGHWLVTDFSWDGSEVVHRSALGAAPGLWPLTWLLQVIPLFFFVGGYANRRSWTGTRRRGAGYASFLDRRMHRLLAPTAVLLAVVLAVDVLLSLTGLPGLGEAGAVLLQPLWFLGIYVVVGALTPVTLRWHERAGWWVVAVYLAVVASVDLLRLAGGVGWVPYVNVLVVWLLAHQLGYLYADGLLTARVGAGMAAAALVALVVLTAGPYPARMVGVPGDRLVNMNPPTAALTALALAHIGVAVVLRRAAGAWLRRPRVWGVVVAVNLSVMSIYLWHQPVFAATARLLGPLGVPQPAPPGPAWWAMRLVWLTVAGGLLGLVVLLVGRFERGAPPAPSPRTRIADVTATTAVVLASAGLLGVAGTDATRPFAVHRVLGALDVAPVVGMVCIGVAMLLLRGARRDRRSAVVALLGGGLALASLGAAYGLGVAGLTPSPRLLALLAVLAGAVLLAVATPEPPPPSRPGESSVPRGTTGRGAG